MLKTYTKRIGLVRRKESLTREQFVEHWLNIHANLCMRLPGLRNYSVNLIDRERFPGFGYDGFSELWFDSEQALEAALESQEGRVLLADLPNFVESIDPLVTEEHRMLWPEVPM